MDNLFLVPTVSIIRKMSVDVPEPDWYLDHLLAYAKSGDATRGPSRVGSEWQSWWRTQAATDHVTSAAAEQGFVLGSADLAALGVTRSQARTAVRRGRWYSPTPWSFAPLDLSGDPVPTAGQHTLLRRRHAVSATAAVLRRPHHVISGRSAAILDGLPTLWIPKVAELTATKPDGLGRHSVAHTFGATLSPAEVGSWFGAPTTTLARTVVDVARHDRRDGIMCVDAALREGLTTVCSLTEALERSTGWPGVRNARAIVSFADPRAESPLESLVRLALHDDGFPTPQLQWPIDAYRVDFCWPDRRLILEADGRVKYTTDDRWAEKRRETALRRRGWTVERVLWSDLFTGWPSFAASLRAHF